MKILWFTWKDKNHPQSGGAETVNEELAKRLVRDGHEVIFLVGGFPGGKREEARDGFKIIRLGSCYTVYWKAFLYYKKNLKEWADIVIDEVNTMPFFAQFYSTGKQLLFVHQLCREIWFYQMTFPLSWTGYLLEPLYLRLLSKSEVITVSQSSKDDLLQYGFRSERVHIISQGIDIDPIRDLGSVQKYPNPTVLSLGAVREMKQTLDQVKAFELAKKRLPNLRMKIAGDASGAYGRKVLRYIDKSPCRDGIEYLGRVSQERKRKLMQKSHCILVTSVKEGWGLIVTEANSQGTPAVGYDTDGLRDSIRNQETGVLAQENTPESLGDAVVTLLQSPEKCAMLGKNAWTWSQDFGFEKSYREFVQILGI